MPLHHLRKGYFSVQKMGSTTRIANDKTKIWTCPHFLRQPVRTQNPSKGELSHGVVEKDLHQGVQAGRSPASGLLPFAALNALQWGRDLVIAEMRKHDSGGNMTAEGFNGAAIW